MTRTSLTMLAVRASRQSITRTVTNRSSKFIRPFSTTIIIGTSTTSRLPSHGLRASPLSPRAFSTTRPLSKGLSPESEDPPTREATTESTEYNVGGVPADLSNERYHELADDYLNILIEKLERMQEESEVVDCEYSAGVLTLAFPPNGTYVLNKQPPNKQIWLSSPLSGPKRYDYVISSEGQDAKEGTGAGEWVYLRDGSTLTEVLEKELGIDMGESYHPVSTVDE